MQPRIKLHLKKLQVGTAAGRLIVQSINTYFAQIELFKYNFTKNTFIDFSVKEPSYFMMADRERNTCLLCYRPKGKYRKTMHFGSHHIILITFKSDWLIYKCQRLPELQPFSSLFFNPGNKELSLPSAGIAESIYKSLQKMDLMINDPSLLDNDGYLFANSCINKYYNKLKVKSATSQFHQRLATEISLFINAHFTTEYVENLTKLAERFMVSERNLARLANIAFGIPLHEQVIKLRMNHAKYLLSNSSKPIKEIALLCGYKDPHYFSNAYKKHYGESPKSTITTQISRLF